MSFVRNSQDKQKLLAVDMPSPLFPLSLLSSGDIISRFDPQTEVSADRTGTFVLHVFPSVLPTEYKTLAGGLNWTRGEWTQQRPVLVRHPRAAGSLLSNTDTDMQAC